MTWQGKVTMAEFKLGDKVRIRPIKSMPERYHFVVGHIVAITNDSRWPYTVEIKGVKYFLAAHELWEENDD